MISLPGTSSYFGLTNRCLSLIWSLWLCSTIEKVIIFRKIQETGEASVVINHVDLIIITKNQHILSYLYFHIYCPSRTHKWFIHSLIYFTTSYPTVTRRENPTEVRGEHWIIGFVIRSCWSKWGRKTYFCKLLVSLSLSQNITVNNQSRVWTSRERGIFST